MSERDGFRSGCGPASSVSARGLHGHLLEGGVVVALLAECVGTCMLVLTIIGTAIAASLARPVAGLPYGSLAVPLRQDSP